MLHRSEDHERARPCEPPCRHPQRSGRGPPRPGRDRAGAARPTQFSEHDIFGIRLALEEALVNAIKHGNQMDRVQEGPHRLPRPRRRASRSHITDEGPGFDPGDVPDPTAVENLERPCGRGLMLMRHYMSEVSFNGRGNSVRMAKVLKK